MVDPQLLALLKNAHTDQSDHLAGSLLEHLVGTYDVLVSWGLNTDLCLAGLFHSVYGTQVFDVQSVTFDERSTIQAAIGERAERLAYTFSVIDRNTLFPQIGQAHPRVYDRVRHQIELVSHEDLRDLIELEIANFIEFSPRFLLRPTSIETWSQRFETANHIVSTNTLNAMRAAFADQRRRTPVQTAA